MKEILKNFLDCCTINDSHLSHAEQQTYERVLSKLTEYESKKLEHLVNGYINSRNEADSIFFIGEIRRLSQS